MQVKQKIFAQVGFMAWLYGNAKKVASCNTQGLSRFAIGGVGYMHGWLIQKKILYSDYPWGVPGAQRRERACQSFARGRLITATESDGSSALPRP